MPAQCPFKELDSSEMTTTHVSQHLGVELVFHDSIQSVQQSIAAFGHEIVSVTPARSSKVSVVEETKHHFADTPPVRPDHYHVLSLPPFRGRLSAVERLQLQEEHSPLSNKPSW